MIVYVVFTDPFDTSTVLVYDSKEKAMDYLDNEATYEELVADGYIVSREIEK